MSDLPITLYDADANGADAYGEPKPPWRERKEACLAATSTKSKAGPPLLAGRCGRGPLT